MTNRSVLPLAAMVGAASLWTGPALADDWGITMPSGNIMCTRDPGEGGNPSVIRCDLLQMPAGAPPAPKDCKLLWGDSFKITYAGKIGERLCHDASDTTRNDHSATLPYGSVWKEGGFTCTSRTTGLTCVNPLGHGFAISREVQRVF